jgi:PilZ domain
MTYFPQPNPAKRASRVKLGSSVVVAIRSEGSEPFRGKLHELSATGGLLILSKAFEQGDFVEVAFQTSKGTVHGMAELLSPRRESASGCLQPFRFVALDDEDHTRLRTALESLLDQTMVGVPSSKPPSL